MAKQNPISDSDDNSLDNPENEQIVETSVLKPVQKSIKLPDFLYQQIAEDMADTQSTDFTAFVNNILITHYKEREERARLVAEIKENALEIQQLKAELAEQQELADQLSATELELEGLELESKSAKSDNDKLSKCIVKLKTELQENSWYTKEAIDKFLEDIQQ